MVGEWHLGPSSCRAQVDLWTSLHSSSVIANSKEGDEGEGQGNLAWGQISSDIGHMRAVYNLRSQTRDL